MFPATWNTCCAPSGTFDGDVENDDRRTQGRGSHSRVNITPTEFQWSSSTVADVDLTTFVEQPFNIGREKVSEAAPSSRGEGLTSRLSLSINLHTALALHPLLNVSEATGPL